MPPSGATQNHPDNPKHATGHVEHMTPLAVSQAAAEVLGTIELDPASTPAANEAIGARRIFTVADNGLQHEWRGRTFLNPPGGLVDLLGNPVVRASKATGEPGCTVSGSCGLAAPHQHKSVTSSAVFWWRKLARHWAAFDVEAAIFVGFSIELLQSTQSGAPQGVPLPLDFPFCVPSARLEFLSEDAWGQLVPGTQPTHANVIVYLPPRFDARCELFAAAFSKIGRVRL